MDCSEEVAAIERALKPVGGVLGVRANLVASSVTVYHDGSARSAKLIEAINRSGVRVQMEETPSSGGNVSLASFLVGTSGLFTGLGIALQWLGLKETLWPDVAFTIAIVAGGTLVFPKALRSLKTFSLDMNVLMTVAVIGAVAIGEHAEGAAVAFLFSLSELLESWSVGRARRSIQALMQLAPDTALVKKGRQFQGSSSQGSRSRRNDPCQIGPESSSRRNCSRRIFGHRSGPHHWRIHARREKARRYCVCWHHQRRRLAGNPDDQSGG